WRVLEIPCRRLPAHLQDRRPPLYRSCSSRRPSQGNLSLVSSLKRPCQSVSGIERGYFESLAPLSMSFFPAIGLPGVDVVSAISFAPPRLRGSGKLQSLAARPESRPVHAFLLRFSCVIAQLCYAMTIFSKMRFTCSSRNRC